MIDSGNTYNLTYNKMTSMQTIKKLTLPDMIGDLGIYFNWLANLLVPITPGAADNCLEENQISIVDVAQQIRQIE